MEEGILNVEYIFFTIRHTPLTSSTDAYYLSTLKRVKTHPRVETEEQLVSKESSENSMGTR